MIDIGTLVGRLTLEDQASASLKTFSGNLDKIGGALTDAGKTLTIGITAPLVAAAGASLLFSGNFEASMTRLVSLAGVSKDELGGVKEAILALAPTVGIGPQKLAEAMTKISSTVDDTSKALKILDISAKLSAAGMGEAVDVAGAITAVTNSYAKSGLTAARAADILTQAVKDGGAEAKELAPTLANVVPIAAQMGVSFEEVGANIATLTKLGVPAAEAVTQLSSVFSALLKETKQGSEALAQVGMSYAGLREEVKTKGLAATLQDLSDKFKGNETALADVFGRIEALRNVMGTAGAQGDTYAKVLDNVKKSSEGVGVAQGAYEAMQGKQLQTWGQVTAAVQVLAIRLGDELAPAMGAVLKLAIPLIDMIGKAVQWFSALPQPVKTVAIGIAAFAAAAGPTIFILGSIVSAFSSLAPLLPIAGAAFAVLTGPIGLVALAVTGLVAAVLIFRKNMDDLERQSNIGRPLDKMKDAAGNAIVPIQDVDSAMAKLGKTASGELVAGMTLSIGSLKKATEAGAVHVTQTKEQIDAAKDLAKKLAEIRKDWANAIRDVGKLTAEQKLSIESHLNLERKVGDIAAVMGLSEVAVKDYADELGRNPARIKAIADEADRLRPKLTLMGFEEARKAAIIPFIESLWSAGEAITDTGDLLESDLNPKLVTTTKIISGTKTPLENFGAGLNVVSDIFVKVGQISGTSMGKTGKAMEIAITYMASLVNVVNRYGEAMKSATTDAEKLSAAQEAQSSSGLIIVDLFIKAYQAWVTSSEEWAVQQQAIELETRRVNDAIYGQKNLSRDLVLEIEKLTASYKDLAKANGFNAGQIAETVKLADTIRDLGGEAGLAADELKRVAQSIDVAVQMIYKGGQLATLGITAIDDAMAELGMEAVKSGGLVSKFFLDELDRLKNGKYGLPGLDISEFKKLNAFLSGQLASAAQGLDAIFIGLQASATASVQAAAKAAGKLSKEEIDALVGVVTVTKEQGAGLAAAVAANFAEMINRGKSWREALDSLKPAIDTLTESLKQSGVDGGAAFSFLSEMARIAADPIMGPLTDAITGVNQALQGLQNSGILNQDMFSALSTTAVDAYNQIIANGGNAAAANLAIQPTLQTIWELQKDYGYAVDDATQALLTQAEAAGTVGDKQRPIQEQMLLATNKIKDAVEALAIALGATLPDRALTGAKGVTDALATIKAPKIDAPWKDWPTPPVIAGDSGGSSTGYAGGGVIYAAQGMNILRGPWQPRGTDTIPAMVSPGERILNVAQNRVYTQDRSGETHVYLVADNRVMAEIIAPELPGALRRLGAA